jgi:ribonuclease HII
VKTPFPTGEIELAFLQQAKRVCGVDEVGRGCLAGPVFAGAAILDLEALLQAPLSTRSLIRDSKTLSAAQRSKARLLLAPYLLESAWGLASAGEVDAYGIVFACFLAMKRAIALLEHPFDHVLVDGRPCIPHLAYPQSAIIKGDQKCFSIAAASIIAKLERDHFMTCASKQYPSYGLETNVGYGTQHHLEALQHHGSCPLHRKSFAPIRDFPAS